jgi:hypothetical protein
VLLALGLCAACSDGDSDGGETPSGQALVTSLIVDNTSLSAEPVGLNELELEFSNDPAAFDEFFE